MPMKPETEKRLKRWLEGSLQVLQVGCSTPMRLRAFDEKRRCMWTVGRAQGRTLDVAVRRLLEAVDAE